MSHFRSGGGVQTVVVRKTAPLHHFHDQGLVPVLNGPQYQMFVRNLTRYVPVEQPPDDVGMGHVQGGGQEIGMRRIPSTRKRQGRQRGFLDPAFQSLVSRAKQAFGSFRATPSTAANVTRGSGGGRHGCARML